MGSARTLVPIPPLAPVLTPRRAQSLNNRRIEQPSALALDLEFGMSSSKQDSIQVQFPLRETSFLQDVILAPPSTKKKMQTPRLLPPLPSGEDSIGGISKVIGYGGAKLPYDHCHGRSELVCG